MEGYDYFDISEVDALLTSMSSEDTLKCIRASFYFIDKYSLSMEAGDLFNEAIVRIYDGSRKVPKGVDLATAINQIMRSISYDILTKRSDEAMRYADSVDDLATIPDTYSSNASQIESEWEGLLAIFEDDEMAMALLQATEAGQKKAEIVNKLFEGEQKAYDTTRRRIIRISQARIKETNL